MDSYKLWDSRWTTSTFGTAGDWIIQPQVGLQTEPEPFDGGGEASEPEILNSGGLQALDQLSTAILLALFTDARLPDYMVGRFGFKKSDQHEWHGNTFSIDRTQGEEPLGSLLWTLRRAPLVPYTARLAEHYAAEALQPLIRQKLIGSYDIVSDIDKSKGRLNLWIRTYDPDRTFVGDIAPLK